MIWGELSPIGESVAQCERKSESKLRALSDQYVFNAGKSDQAFSDFLAGMDGD